MNHVASRCLFGLLWTLGVACASGDGSSPSAPSGGTDVSSMTESDGQTGSSDASATLDVPPREEDAGTSDTSVIKDVASPEETSSPDDVAPGEDASEQETVAPGDIFTEEDAPGEDSSSGQDVSDPADVSLEDAGPVEDAAVEEDAGPEGWPSNPDKAQIPDPGWDSAPSEGTVIPNFIAVDQYGDQVELYDLAGQGVPVVLDVGTWFCEPCKGLAAYLSDGDESHMDPFLWWKPQYTVVRDMVNSGQIRWVTVLYSLGSYVGPEEVALWHEEFPNDNVVVLADSDLQLQEYLSVSAMPRIDVLDENMVFQIYAPGGPAAGMQYLSSLNVD